MGFRIASLPICLNHDFLFLESALTVSFAWSCFNAVLSWLYASHEILFSFNRLDILGQNWPICLEAKTINTA